MFGARKLDLLAGLNSSPEYFEDFPCSARAPRRIPILADLGFRRHDGAAYRPKLARLDPDRNAQSQNVGKFGGGLRVFLWDPDRDI